MEHTLIMNKVPLPRYFDGQNWNTVFRPTRKSIPKYLHQDLPELKLQEIKERFKQIGQINCPKLEYFNNFITKRKINVQKKSQTARSSQKKQYEKLQQQLQYALLMCDKESPVLDKLVNQAKNIKYNKKVKETNKKCFDGTLDLVFRNRKNQYISQQKNKVDQSITQLVAEKVKHIHFQSVY